MERTYSERDLEQALRRTAPGDAPRPDFAAWRKNHPDAASVDARRVGVRANESRSIGSLIRFGRNAMKRTRAKFGAVAAAILVALVFFAQGTGQAWSVGQTIAAMKKIETLHITGRSLCGGQWGDFECWVAQPGAGADALQMRYQCGCSRKSTVFVQGDTVYEYSPVENEVHIGDGSKIEDLQYWYEGAQLSPWLTGKMLEVLRLIGRDWEQTVVTDPDTGAEQILVTCSHPPSDISFHLVVDPESKLILRAKLWKNLQWEGEPSLDAQVFTYNPEIPDGFFEFEMPEGVTVIDRQAEQAHAERESAGDALLNRAEHLFHEEKNYVDAAKVYQQVYDQYGDQNIGEHALMMVGLCHRRLGQPDKEIAAYEKTVSEYAHLKGWVEATYFYLGRAYLEQGQKDKALKAFQNCLAAGEGVREPDQFPLKEAREAIAQIKGQ